MTTLTKTLMTTALALAAVSALAQSKAPPQGVSKGEILIGSIQDLSGPVVAFGMQSRDGMQLRVDEINEPGCMSGRKLKPRG